MNPWTKEHKTYFKQKLITRGFLDVDLEKSKSAKVQAVEVAPIDRHSLQTLPLFSLYLYTKTRS
jgi:hypothetical protein